MSVYKSGAATIRMEEHARLDGTRRPALILLHGAGGNTGFWIDRLAPLLSGFGVALFAPHYFEKTGTVRATPETILDGRHFPEWLAATSDAISHVASHQAVAPARIAVLGVSLGGYLAMALAAREPRLRAVVELSGGMPPGFAHGLSPASPPILVLHGAADTTVPVSQAHALVQLLEQRGVRHQVDILPRESHWFSVAAQQRLLVTCGAFLSQHL